MANQLKTSDVFAYAHNSFQRYRHTDNSAGIPCHFLARMRRGTGRIVPLRGKELILHPGDLFYLPQGLSYHSYWYGDEMSDGRMEWDTFSFTYLPEFTGKHLSPQIIETDEECERLWAELMQARYDTMCASGHLYLLIGHALPRMTLSDGNVRRELLEKVKDHMAHHLDESVEQSARACHISVSGLYQLFREQAGMTTTEWKNRVRVERAVSLLSSTDLSVEQISERTGFCSSTYFRKIVKQTTGLSPREIRRKAQNGTGV